MKNSLFLFALLCISWPAHSEPTLTVVTELSPPNQTLINNQVAGDSTQLVKSIFAKANLTANIELYPWARAYSMALKKPNTLIYSMAKTPERESKFEWIGAVATYRMGFVKLTQRADINITASEQAKQYKVAVQRDDLSAKQLSERGYTLIYTSDITRSYQLLISGKVDLIVDDKNYIAAMADQLAQDEHNFTFAHTIDFLAMKGYLAANKNTDPNYIKALKDAFLDVAKSQTYRKVMMQTEYN
ncbi:transporter substrate-binding domain-containing protein [Pseudoalteromonas sp. L1]|uniref:substrate-binding periplasmic protein n=1 Tax=Pseudoalteromonas sp. L1 TaxID=195716 RepID=UPI001F44AE3D|nr:transporter substrate-binding domain-containing protein [Pseudoalteromonas sp. L1]